MYIRAWLIVVLTVVLFACGFWVGRDSASRQDVTSVMEVARTGDGDSRIFDRSRNASALIPGETAFGAFLAELNSFPPSDRSLLRLFFFISQLSLAELPDAFAAVERVPSSMCQHLRALLFQRWGELDPKGALASALELKDAAERIECGTAIVVGWSERNAHDALSWVKELPTGRLREECLHQVIRALAAVDPGSALQEAEAIPNFSKRRNSIYMVFSIWGEQDPLAAGTRMMTLPPGTLRNQVLANLAEQWSERDPQAAMSWANQVQDSKERNQLLSPIINRLAEQNPEAAAVVIATMGSKDLQSATFRTIMEQWARKDVEAALNWVQQLPGSLQEEALASGIYGWVTQDPKAAWETAAGWPDDNKRRLAVRQIIESISEDAPWEAAKLAQLLRPGDEQTWAVGIIAGALAEVGVSEAKQWLESITDPALKVQAMTAAASRLGESDPRAALELATSIPASFQQRQAVAGALSTWAQQDAPSAIRWAEQLNNPALHCVERATNTR